MNKTPVHDKVVAGSLGLAVAQVAVWLIETGLHEPLPFAVSSAITIIVSFACGYFVPESKPPTA